MGEEDEQETYVRRQHGHVCFDADEREARLLRQSSHSARHLHMDRQFPFTHSYRFSASNSIEQRSKPSKKASLSPRLIPVQRQSQHGTSKNRKEKKTEKRSQAQAEEGHRTTNGDILLAPRPSHQRKRKGKGRDRKEKGAREVIGW